MGGDGSTPRTRELGDVLRVRRVRAGLSGRALSAKIGWPAGKVSSMETGRRAPSTVDVAQYLASCLPLYRPEYQYALGLANEQEHPSGHWLRAGQSELDDLPAPLRSLIVAENAAQTIDSYSPGVIPGLFQTEQYIRALFDLGSTLTSDENERRIQLRLSRQALLTKPAPPRCTFFVHERALRTTLGNPQVMHEQILKLVLSINCHCAIRVVLEAAGPYAVASESFIVFGHERYAPIVYTDTWTAAVFAQDPAAVGAYQAFLTKLDGVALTAGQSRSWLAGLASHYDRVEAQHSCDPASSRGERVAAATSTPATA